MPELPSSAGGVSTPAAGRAMTDTEHLLKVAEVVERKRREMGFEREPEP
jgi:hypothetical protein